MKRIKVFIEKSDYGYSAYMEESSLDYGLFGEGKTVEEAIDDFNKSYAGMREYYGSVNKAFEEIQYEFFYDTASFLQEFAHELTAVRFA